MIFGEGLWRDAYRRMVWGPVRRVLEVAPVPWELAAVRGMGRLAAVASPGRSARVQANLTRALAHRHDLDSVTREAFASHFSNQYLSFSFAKCSAPHLDRYLRFEDLQRLDAAHEKGKGVVLMHPHMGPAQLPLHVLGCLGWPMHQIGGGRVTAVELSPTGAWAAQLRHDLESRMPVTVHDGRRFLRPVLRALGDGGVVMSACDGTGGGEEIGRRYPREVLGVRMAIPVGPVWLALKSGAPLLTVLCRRDRTGSAWFVADVGSEIELLRDHEL
ncbi:MAG: hypothetical protein QGG40_17375, partial [Myxococcota bacterium]|nr:hypothetical protein [Myxococcota bacterium]